MVAIPLKKSECSAQYVCSLSKKLRTAIQLASPNNDGVRKVVVGIVEQFESDASLKASLKQQPEPGKRILRQVDIRFNPDEPIQFKVFVEWNWNFGMWHVFMEGADESVFENGETNW